MIDPEARDVVEARLIAEIESLRAEAKRLKEYVAANGRGFRKIAESLGIDPGSTCTEITNEAERLKRSRTHWMAVSGKKKAEVAAEVERLKGVADVFQRCADHHEANYAEILAALRVDKNDGWQEGGGIQAMVIETIRGLRSENDSLRSNADELLVRKCQTLAAEVDDWRAKYEQAMGKIKGMVRERGGASQ